MYNARKVWTTPSLQSVLIASYMYMKFAIAQSVNARSANARSANAQSAIAMQRSRTFVVRFANAVCERERSTCVRNFRFAFAIEF